MIQTDTSKVDRYLRIHDHLMSHAIFHDTQRQAYERSLWVRFTIQDTIKRSEKYLAVFFLLGMIIGSMFSTIVIMGPHP